MPSKISHNKTLASIEDVTSKASGISILLKPSADSLSIVNDIKLGLFTGKRKVVEEFIKTLLLKARRPISTVIKVANRSKVIFIPMTVNNPADTEAVLSYHEEGREFSVKFKL